ncbi:MAG TPA: thioredoxin domain-containing protein [Anaerolineales bacterium]|nr:thioredoxin domain-containing protein [Anaerolineales bacterium]
MPNHLNGENSPYLLQHANNPVDWYPWGEEALSKARAENKPIFLSIGYAACHWCHVMAHESFEDQETATLMNEHFVNIKVDREERPDLDAIYMQATVAMTGSGGWPMSVFLTPDLKPFYAGTYFPPVQRSNMPAFKDVLTGIARAWNEETDEITRVSAQVASHLQQALSSAQTGDTTFTQSDLEAAVKALIESYDWGYGGWGSAPKFPQPMTIEFLLRRALADSPQHEQALKASVHVLNAMSRGGMYDAVGGGFARYSVDNFWRTPHFEKMLYDNAQLASVYLHAYLVTGEKRYRWVCEETLDFLLREMADPDGGFYSSLDADSEGEEGKFYVWTQDEIQSILGPDFDFFNAAYGITSQGNWEGKTILQRALDDSTLAAHFKLDPETPHTKLGECHSKLLKRRNTRVRPGTDDKVLVMWNALALSAFAEAGRYLGRKDYLEAAIRNARFLLDNLYVTDRLLRSWREGHAKHNAYLEDYAGLTLALLALYQSDPNREWYTTALILADQMVARFTDPNGGFFDTRDDHEALLVRPKDIQDNATPSGNALAATVLLQLATYGDRSKWRDTAEAMLASVQNAILRYPTSFAQWLSAADFAVGPTREVAIVGGLDDARTQALLRTLWKDYRPRQVTAISAYPPVPGSPVLLQDRPLLNDQPTAYVCQGFICLMPVNSPDEMEAQLAGNPVQ